jgi:glycosyltransferase involved in cell wall biosynthesis
MNIVVIGPHAFRPKATVRARALHVAKTLVKNGHSVTILMPPYDNVADSGRAWEQDGVHLENMVLSHNDAWHQLIVPLRMARRTLQIDPDVIHLFKPIGYSGMTGVYLMRFSKRPLVLDTDDWEGTGGWADVNALPAFWRRLFDWQERWVARHAGAVTVASHTLQTQVWGFGVEPTRVVYLPNGPDPALRELEPVGDGEKLRIRSFLGVGNAPLLLYLGHIPNGTDLDLALDAMVHLQKRLPEAKLVIAGLGDGLPCLKGLADSKGLAGRVIFPGWVEQNEARALIAAADVIVNPYRDNLINRSKCAGKVIAAMAAGRPIVSSRVGENLQYIEDGHSGLLTEPGNTLALAQAIAAVLSDRDWAAELGRNAQRRIWDKFAWDARLSEVERAYQIAQGRLAVVGDVS